MKDQTVDNIEIESYPELEGTLSLCRQKLNKKSILKIRFYKEEEKWYADIPDYINQGGSKDELEMVSGADIWLSFLSERGEEITLEISLNPFEGFEAKLLYVGDSNQKIEGEYLVYPDIHYLWLCSVTVWLFGEYPQSIYYKTV
jgi:hypothetical protein